MATTIFTILFLVTVLWGAIVGLIRGMEKATIRLITLLLAAVATFAVAGPVAELIARSIRLEGLTLGQMLLENLLQVDMVGRIIQAAPLMQEAILVAPVFVIAIPVFPLVFAVLKFISWILHLIICKPLCRLFFGRRGEEKPSLGARLGKRFAGLGIGVLTGMLIFAMLSASVLGLFSLLPDADAANKTMDAMVEQELMQPEDAALVREIYAVTDCALVKAHQTMGVSGLGRRYLNSVSEIEADGQKTHLGDEFDSLLAVAQTAVEGGLVEALMTAEDEGALYAVLSDTGFVNALMQDMFSSKLLRAAAPEVMSIALESMTQSLNLPGTKNAIYANMMDSVALAVRQADIDYAGIAAYEQAHGMTRTALMTEEAYRAEVQKRSELEKTISSILDRAVAGDNRAFTDSVAAQMVLDIQTRAANAQTAVEQFDAADVQMVLSGLDPAALTAGEADAAQLLEQLQDVDKFETDLATADAIVEKISHALVEALGDDAKTEQTVQALANIVSGLVGAISGAMDEQGNLNIGDLDFGMIGDVVTELQNSPLKDVGSALLDMVISSDLGEDELISNVMSAVQEGYENGEDIGSAIETVGALVNLGAAMSGGTENEPSTEPGNQPGTESGNQPGSQPGNESGGQTGNEGGSQQEAIADSLTSLIENLNEFTISLLPSVLNEQTFTSMGVPAEYADATYGMVETLLTELMELKGAADYENEVNAILHLYDLATTGVENFTEEDIPELVTCALQSDAIYNTIISVSGSNPFGIEIPDQATRTQIADAIEEYYDTHSNHSARERALYQAVAALLGLDAEVNLAA